MKKAIFNWSGGKDSAIALYHILNNKEYDVSTLLTSVNEKFKRISMHGVRTELLDEQAKQLNIPLHKLQVPEMPTMETYDALMHQTLSQLKKDSIDYSIFGDIFLEDLKKYREDQLAKVGMKGIFPIWKRPTKELVKEFIDLGFKTITVCVNDKYLDQSFVGRIIDEKFLKELPENVDPCGENGEFHTFVSDGPIFENPIEYSIGDVVYRKYEPCAKEKEDSKEKSSYQSHDDVFSNGFWYCDLIPK